MGYSLLTTIAHINLSCFCDFVAKHSPNKKPSDSKERKQLYTIRWLPGNNLISAPIEHPMDRTYSTFVSAVMLVSPGDESPVTILAVPNGTQCWALVLNYHLRLSKK